MRALKWVAIAVGGLLGLLLFILLGVRLFVNPNDFKGRIVKAVHESTGRELALPGDIQLSVFPWIALELGPASLGNPPGFPAEPFAAVKRARLRMQLLPLLRKELRIGRIEVDGLDLRLNKDAQGKGNWQDFRARRGASEITSSPTGGSLRDLAGISVKDGRISYADLVVDGVNLEVGRVASGVTTPVRGKLRLTSGKDAVPIDVSTQFDATLDLPADKYALSNLDVAASRPAAAGLAALSIKFDAPQVQADLAAQTVAAPAFVARLAGANVTGSLAGSKIVDAPRFVGTFTLEPTSARELMGNLGVTPPKTRDPKALARLAASSSFSFGGNAAEVHALNVQLDDSSLRGKAGITDFKTGELSFELTLDQINFDRYRAPPEASARNTTPAAPGEDKAASNGLKTLRANGTLAVGSATVAGVKVTQLSFTLAAKDGVTRIAPARAKVYGGDYTGDITLDDRGATPAFKIDQSMVNVDVAPLLHDLADSNRISGRGRVVSNLAARGLASGAILGSLNGRVVADLDNGAIEGIDLWFEINRALAIIQKQGLPSGSSSRHTKFDVFHASADLTNGVAATKDLSIISQNLRIAGKGTTNLVSQAINYQAQATILRQPTRGAVAASNILAQIPVNITGTMSSPKVAPNLEGIAKARVLQELDKHKDELKQKLQDQLENLFK